MIPPQHRHLRLDHRPRPRLPPLSRHRLSYPTWKDQTGALRPSSSLATFTRLRHLLWVLDPACPVVRTAVHLLPVRPSPIIRLHPGARMVRTALMGDMKSVVRPAPLSIIRSVTTPSTRDRLQARTVPHAA